MQTTFVSAPYRPSAPITGNGELSIFRGNNQLLRGQLGNLVYSAYTGSRDLSEPLPTQAITGTVSFSPASLTVTGTTTAFQDELHNGQMIWTGSEALAINQIASQTSLTVYTLPTTTGAGATVYRTRNLIPLDTKRASLLWGNACKTDKGNIIAVGDGELYVNGAVLPGTSLTADRRAQIALYDGTTDTYDVQDLGFDSVPAITNAAITVVTSGGTKNTSVGSYSFMLAYYSDITDGYGNPTGVLLSGGTVGYAIAGNNYTFRIDKSADASPPSKATGYIIYATAFGGSDALSKLNAINGPWYELIRVPFTSFTANLYAFDYVDSDLSSVFASADNDAPPDAEFVSLFTGYVNLLSTNGAGVNSGSRTLETSPGPLISPMKADNIDGYPATVTVPTAEGETIIGFVSAAGRLFPMTANTLQASTPTGLPQSPFTLRPFWQRGFANPYSLVFTDDTLYGFTSKGPYRSIATGDEAQESNSFASSVDAQMATWSPGYVMCDVDPRNVCVCFFHSACSQNDAGYWQTEVYLYSLKINDWLPPVLLTDDTRDLIVTGTARVHNTLYFVAGGRREGTTDQFSTWEFDGGNTGETPWYLAFSYSDFGAELTPKTIRKLRPKGIFTDATLQVYAVTPNSAISITDLENGDNAAYEVALDDSTEVTQYGISKMKVKGALMGTIRLEGTSTSDVVNQFDECVLEIDHVGQLR